MNHLLFSNVAECTSFGMEGDGADEQEHPVESDTGTGAGSRTPGAAGSLDTTALTRPPAPHTILVVDDDPFLCKLFDRMLSSSRYTVLTAETGPVAQDLMRQHEDQVDVALVDLNLGDENGLDVLKALRDIDDSIIGVVITGDATFDNAIGALQMGAYDFIQKPVVRGSLIAVLERAIKYRQLLVENKRYQIHLEDMVEEKHAALLQALEEVKATSQFALEAMAAHAGCPRASDRRALPACGPDVPGAGPRNGCLTGGNRSPEGGGSAA